MESSRTSLASRTSSRTHFQVLGLGLGLEGQVLGLGLGLEASSPRKLPCPRLEDSTIFWTDEISLENARNIAENLRGPLLFSSLGAKALPRGGGLGVHPPSQLKFHQWQNCDKKAYSFFSISFFLPFFAYNSITKNNIEDQGLRVPLNSIFASQFKRMTRRKRRVFFLKVAISGPHLVFLWT